MKSYATIKKEVQQLSAALEPQRADIQGLLYRGYDSLNAARHIFFTITDAVAAKKYFNHLTNHYITTAAEKSDAFINHDPETAVQLAFTITGLEHLELAGEICDTFSREFKEGISYSYDNPHHPGLTIHERSRLLGDTRRNKPENWKWGNKAKPVDCVLLLYAENNDALDPLISEVCPKKTDGLELAYMVENYQYPTDTSKEHFGFEDGLSQPLIRGLTQSRGEMSDEKLINPGEFILGYKNEYNSYSPSPYTSSLGTDDDALDFLPGHSDKKDLGKNGTYLVFRQIEQHVEKFWAYHYHHSNEKGVTASAKAVRLAAKMIGRWPNGQPMVNCPEGDCPKDDDKINNFNYAGQDPSGIRCPFGAHIRRTNPRDQVHTGRDAHDSLEMSKKHRMLRRGRIYGEPLDTHFNIDNLIAEGRKMYPDKKSLESLPEDADKEVPTTRGLHFICLVSDIERQFEFVQNVWANTSTFADLCNEVDPVISPRPTDDQPHCHEFTAPQELVRNRYQQVPEFTTVTGGAYFFMPGINALKYILK